MRGPCGTSPPADESAMRNVGKRLLERMIIAKYRRSFQMITCDKKTSKKEETELNIMTGEDQVGWRWHMSVSTATTITTRIMLATPRQIDEST